MPDVISSLHLDLGEKEAIALSMAKKALLLIDEERGRKAAREKNIPVKGSLGVLIEAYRKDLISKGRLSFYFEEIMNRNDIWINQELCVSLLDQLFREDDPGR
ncbi:hypothetical protein QUF76_11590 [Desulfobacterales bacterium HSG16]|nr:hypothetical protein [Desulfobacterales bacterium HSG16]